MEELEALIALCTLPEMGSVKIRLLMQHYGSAAAALQAPLAELVKLPGVSPRVLPSWERAMKDAPWKRNLHLAKCLHAEIIPFTSPLYPKRLLEIADYPLLLYVQGNWCEQDQRCLAIVGTRQAGVYGREMARKLSRELAQAGFTIVSGLARGIDTAAHEGALEGGRTIAVLGSGLAHLYPSENTALAQSIRKNGALLSEFPMDTSPNRYTFPRRNRIVSGMSLGTLVVEAPLQSGAMLTAKWALAQGRPLFALPGRADLEGFQGNHALIKNRQAELIENVQDLLNHFPSNPLPIVSRQARPLSLFPLTKEEEDFLMRMPVNEISVEELIISLQKPVAHLNVLLMSLVLKKMVKEYPGKIYKKI